MVRGGAITLTQDRAEERLGLQQTSWAPTAPGLGVLQAPPPSRQRGGGLSVPLMKTESTDQYKEHMPYSTLLRALIWGPAMRKTTMCLWMIWFPISFAGNGFAVFLPMMQRSRDVPAHDVMWDNVLWACAGTVGILFGSALLEARSLGRKRTLSIGLSGCAVSYLAFALAKTDEQMVVVSCINNIANNIAWGALFTYTAEVHPTELRALGCGMANAIKSLAGIFGPYVAGAFIGQDPSNPSAHKQSPSCLAQNSSF